MDTKGFIIVILIVYGIFATFLSKGYENLYDSRDKDNAQKIKVMEKLADRLESCRTELGHLEHSK
jgi:hypothetical protein